MPTLSLATFNTHYGLLPGSRGVAGPPFDLAAALRACDAEVLLIQEVWRPDGLRGALDDAADELGMQVHYALHGRATARARWPHSAAGGEGTIGVAILTALPTTLHEPIVVGPTPSDPVPKRSVLHAEIEIDGSPLRVLCAHLSSRLPHAPLLQLRRLAPALPAPGTPAVVGGDFNVWGPGVRAVLRGWRDAVLGRTWPARRPHSQIDHVLVRPADVEVLGGSVLPNLGSDHRPIRTELRF